jgi:hypothetical protein
MQNGAKRKELSLSLEDRRGLLAGELTRSRQDGATVNSIGSEELENMVDTTNSLVVLCSIESTGDGKQKA